MRRWAALLVVALVAVAGPADARRYAGREVPDEPVGRVAGVTPISTINANNASGISNLEFSVVTVEGVAQLPTGAVDPFDRAAASTWFWVSDGTGGLAISFPGQVPTAVASGDSVSVTAAVVTQGATPIRGTRTLDLGFFGGTIMVIGSGAVDTPVAVTPNEIATNGAAWEGTRVRLDGLTIVNPGAWPAAGSSGFVQVTDGTGQVRLFIDEDLGLGGTPPVAFDLLGFVAQDDASPFNDNHTIYAGSASDLVVGDGSGSASVTPTAVPTAASGVTLTFTVIGQSATLETVELDVPVTWTWPALAEDVSVSGPGFPGGASVSVVPGSPPTIRVTGAALTSSSSGTLVVSNLGAPSSPGLSTFPVRTAILGGTPAAIASSPAVNVVTSASPGDVVVNEVYAVTAHGSTREEAEFIELYNRSGGSLDISGWTLSDIGRTAGCTLDSRWAFPTGTQLPAGGYVVVCRTARDPNNPANPSDDEGFLVEFPGFSGLLFEMYDPEPSVPLGDFPGRTDDAGTPNMVLLDSHPGVDDQIRLLGGSITNAGQCESPNIPGRLVPFQELIVLRDVLGAAVDAFEYREIGPCTTDLCTGPYTGADDAYPYGAPKPGHSLGRNASSADTDSSAVDVLPASVVTPGAANVPGDTVPPALLSGAGNGVSATVIEIRYDEPVDDATATDPANYLVTGSGGESYAVHEIIGDTEEPQRHYLVVTDPMPASLTGTLFVSGVSDLAIGGGAANVLDGSGPFSVPAAVSTVCDVQAYDEAGFSPLEGETVVFAGYVTLGDVPASAPGDAVPTDRVSIWVQEPGGCGVNVFAFLPEDPAEYGAEFVDVRDYGIRINDFVRIRGVVTEFVSTSSGSGAVTEIAGITDDTAFYEFVAHAPVGPAPIEVTTSEANDEALEGTLVHTEGTVINSNSLAAWIDDGSGSTQVFQNFSSLDLTRFTVGDRLDVTGIITQFDSSEPFLDGYELVPQNQDAISKVDGRFAQDGPSVRVDRRVLVPDLGETIEIFTRSPSRSDMIVEIYDAVGRKVTTLYDGVGLGEMTFHWDGRGQDGSTVDPGVYVCHARAVALDGGSEQSMTAPIVVGLRLDGGGVAR
jgi:hypothetical protein